MNERRVPRLNQPSENEGVTYTSNSESTTPKTNPEQASNVDKAPTGVSIDSLMGSYSFNNTELKEWTTLEEVNTKIKQLGKKSRSHSLPKTKRTI